MVYFSQELGLQGGGMHLGFRACERTAGNLPQAGSDVFDRLQADVLGHFEKLKASSDS